MAYFYARVAMHTNHQYALIYQMCLPRQTPEEK